MSTTSRIGRKRKIKGILRFNGLFDSSSDVTL
jgi:hypothetical protein